MLFGLTNAPAVFQLMVNDILRDMISHFVFVYLDNILIFSASLKEHIQHVRQVLQRLLSQLIVKAEKCKFHQPTVQFLGFVVSRGQEEIDSKKTKAVMEWSPPTNKGASTGFANYIVDSYKAIVLWLPTSQPSPLAKSLSDGATKLTGCF